MADKYNAEGYFSPTEHEAFTRLEKEEKAVRKAAAFRPIVYICSPYSGDTERNICRLHRTSILRSSWTTIFQRNGIQPFL